MTAVGLTVWCHVIEFDASSPLKSVTLTSLAAGNNTLYTVPPSTTAEFLPVYTFASATTIIHTRLAYGNFSGVSRNVSINLVQAAAQFP